MKTMKFDERELTFEVGTYGDMFRRKAVLAYDVETGEVYGDVTINIPQYSLDDGECFISADCPDLINEMRRQKYLIIVGKIQVNMGTYQIGKFTKKFVKEFESEGE